MRRTPGTVVLDVREPDEYEQGALPGALHIPRATSRARSRTRCTDHDAPLVVYCAGGVRSAFAAKTLAELGYTDVVSMAGGFDRGRTRAASWPRPRQLTADQRNRYQRHLLLPEVGDEGQLKLLEREGAAARRRRPRLTGRARTSRPPASARSASSTWTSSTSRTCSARSCTTSTASASARSTRRRRRSRLLNPDVNVVTYDVRLGADNVLDIIDGYDVDRRRRRQLPDPLPAQRRVAAEDGIPVVHGSIFRFEGQATVFNPYDGPCYRCMIPEPPPAELAPSCAEAGVLGVLPGIIGSIQALEAIKLLLGLGDSLAGRLLAYDALEESFRTYKVQPRPELPGVLDRPGRHRHRRVRRVLHAASGTEHRATEHRPRPGPTLIGMADDERRTDSGHRDQARSYTAEDLAGWDPAAQLGAPGRAAVHPRHLPDDVPGPALDDAPVRRLRHGRGDERSGSTSC